MAKKEIKMAKKTTGHVTNCRVKVVFKRGVCMFGHEVGDEWILDRYTPEGICNYAYHAFYPNVRIIQRKGDYQFPAGSGVIRSGCPDAWNQVVFELSPVQGTPFQTPPLPETSGHLEYLR